MNDDYVLQKICAELFAGFAHELLDLAVDLLTFAWVEGSDQLVLLIEEP
jgi:hypothetical protein